jgi:DNA-binding FrmR family transcriptional regulator
MATEEDAKLIEQLRKINDGVEEMLNKDSELKEILKFVHENSRVEE